MSETKKKAAPAAVWQNRIVGYGEKPAKDFKFNPLNWREHSDAQKTALNQVLTSIGWVTGVIENQVTGNLVDGHARVGEALTLDENTPIPFVKVELTEDEEREILALLDPIGALAKTNYESFRILTESIESDNALLATMRETLELSNVDLSDFFEEKPDVKEIITEKFSIELEYDRENYDAVSNGLGEIDKSPAEAVKKLLQL